MKKIILIVLLAIASVAIAQTVIAPISGVYNASSGTLVGALNRNTGAEEPFSSTAFRASTLSTGANLTLTAGAIGMPKITASGTAPGATGGKLELVCGTNSGTAKLVMSAGTSTAATTVLDNIGAGVTGC